MAIRPIEPRQKPELSLPRARVRTRPAPDTFQEEAEATCLGEAAQTETEYKVGFKNPPRHSQFKPGRSGNPKGRPKAAKGLHSLVRDTLTQKVAVRTQSGTKRISRIEAVLQKTVEQAMKGNPRALAELLKLYGNAVPNEANQVVPESCEENLTATDLATLDELRILLTAGGEEQS